MKFRMQGNVIHLIRWVITHAETEEYAVSEAEKDAVEARLAELGTEYAVQQVQQPDYAWLDGKEVTDLDEAWRLAELGEAGYLAEIAAPTEADYRVELDYRLSKLELGV